MLITILTLGWKGNINTLRSHANKCFLAKWVYLYYLKKHQSYIPLTATIGGNLRIIHLTGIHVASNAIIGNNCTMYQHVTIGSNYLEKTKCPGAPVIGNNVLIGANACIIGGVNIGDNVKIGAGCIVTEDIPSNSVVVMNKPRVIIKNNNVS